MPERCEQNGPHGDETFRRLLVFLDGRTEEAPPRENVWESRADNYEAVRRKLTRLFVWKGCPESEADVLTDQTFDRIMMILDRGDKGLDQDFEGNALYYALRVGRNIFLEWARTKPPRPHEPSRESTEETAERERLHQRLDECLETALSGQERELILEYYRGERRSKIDWRKELAESHQLSANALRIHVCRIRTKLRKCVLERMREK